RVRLEWNGTERGDRVDDERRIPDRLLDGPHVRDHTRRCIGLLAKDEVETGLPHGRAHLVRVGRLSPLVANGNDVDPMLLADRDPALAEGAETDDRNAVAALAA